MSDVEVIRMQKFIKITDHDQTLWLHIGTIPDLIEKLQGVIE